MLDNIPASSNENNNFDIQQLINIVGQSAVITNQISQQMGLFKIAMDGMTSDINTLKIDMENIKYNEEITTNQVDAITDSAKRRVIEILGNNPDDHAKYFRSFIRKLYSDAKSAGLSHKIARTKKGDFQRIINYVECWIPECGCADFKRKIDKKAEVNRCARENGYA